MHSNSSDISAGAESLGVAVIMPVLNGARLIGDTLDSVLSQTHAPTEIVVVDDGCTDDTVAVASSRKGVRVVRNPGKGLEQGRQFGIASTTAPLVAMLDHDDLWHEDHLRLMARGFAAHPDASAVLAHPVHFADGTQPKFDPPREDPAAENPWDLFPGSFTTTPSSVVIRRSALEAVGGWTDGEFDASGELYMWLRLFEAGPLVVNRCASAAYRVHGESMSMAKRKSGAEYADRIAAAAEAAVRARLAQRPDEARDLERRIKVARAVRHLGAGIFNADSREIAEGARLLEEGTEGEPWQRVATAFFPLFWLVEGHAGNPGVEHRIWRPLIEGWPREASRTAPFRLRFNSMRHLVTGAIRDPLASWRWRWVTEAAMHRLRAPAA